MLSERSLAAAAQVASGLTASGIRLEAINGSPLYAAMSAMQVMPSEGDPMQNVNAAAKPIHDAFDGHTGEVRNAVNMLAARVSLNLNIAQNTVNPLCREIVLSAEKHKREIESNSALNVKVVPYKALSLLNTPELDAKLERFKDGGFRRVNLPRGLIDRILDGQFEADLEAILEKGAGSDASLAEAYANISEYFGFTEPLRDVLFSGPRYETGRKEMIIDPTSVLNFLFLEAVLQGRMESFSLNDVSLEERTLLSKQMAYYGYETSLQISRITTLAKSNDFIFPLSSDKNTVYVYFRNYSQWLEKGGSAEALIAATAISDGRLVTVMSRLRDEPAYYEGEYKRIEGHKRDISRVEVIRALQSHVEQQLFIYINSELEDDAVPTAAANAKAFFKVNRIQSNTDIAMYVRRAVCATIAQGTSVETILNDMDYYIDNHDEATHSRALAFALARLLGRHAANQVKAVRNQENMQADGVEAITF